MAVLFNRMLFGKSSNGSSNNSMDPLSISKYLVNVPVDDFLLANLLLTVGVAAKFSSLCTSLTNTQRNGMKSLGIMVLYFSHKR